MERQPGFYWIQHKPYDQMTVAYYCGQYGQYQRWCIGEGKYISWREIYKISDVKIERPKILQSNPDYDPINLIR